MASFANSLRNLLGRGQPASSSTLSSIAHFDGMNETDQQMLYGGATSVETASNDALPVENHSVRPMVGQSELSRQDCTQQLASSHGFDQSGRILAVQQGKRHFDHTHNTIGPSQELVHDDFGQYDEWRRQVTSRTATAQRPENPPYDLRMNYPSYASQLRHPVSNVGADVQVRKESEVKEHDEQDIFAEFTNESLDDDNDIRPNGESQEVFKSSEHTAFDPPSIKQEPAPESRPLAEAVEQAKGVEPTVTSATMMQQTKEISPSLGSHVTPQDVASSSRVDSESAYFQSQASSTGTTVVERAPQPLSFGPHTQVAQQSIGESQVQHGDGNTLRSPSVDSVIGARRISSEETASSHGGMDLATNSQLAMQWQGRQKPFGNGGLTADAVHMNPVLLHGPRPARDQIVVRPATATHRPHSSSDSLPPMSGMQYKSAFQYKPGPTHPTHPVAMQYVQSQPLWMTPDWHFSSSNSQELPGGHSSTQDTGLRDTNTSQRVTEGHGEEGSVSDDDEPLVTRAPRHRSTTASPVPAHVQSENADVSVPGSHTSKVKQSSIVERSDDADEDKVEAISWKLPDYEITYHPAVTDKDLPMAKVSILGEKENLVRREVSLTEDHAQQEMELFLNVFLPAQKALQTPDAEPAHAVINFHTISVMVLEAFVQYEIGDEMGRGYGFHGGNIGNQVLRPRPASIDEEPIRTRSAQDADVDEIFFAVIDRWRAGLISGKGTLKLIRGCQEFCEIALDVIHYVKEYGLSQPEPKKRKERSDKGVKRGPQGGTKESPSKGKVTGKRKAEAAEVKAPAKKAKVNELTGRKKAKDEVKKPKPKPKAKTSGITIIKK